MKHSNSLLALLAIAPSGIINSNPLFANAARERTRKKNKNKKQNKEETPDPTASPSYYPTQWPTYFPSVEPTPKPTRGRRTKNPTVTPTPEPTPRPTPMRGPPEDASAAIKPIERPLQTAGIVVAVDDFVSLDIGTIDAYIGVLENDVGTNLAIQAITSDADFGTCNISIDLAEVVYFPPSSEFVGSDSCTYEVCDEEEDCDEAVVLIQIKPDITSSPTEADDTREPTTTPTASVTPAPQNKLATLDPTFNPPPRPPTPIPTELIESPAPTIQSETPAPTAESGTITNLPTVGGDRSEFPTGDNGGGYDVIGETSADAYLQSPKVHHSKAGKASSSSTKSMKVGSKAGADRSTYDGYSESSGKSSKGRKLRRNHRH
mmetsp:Transcript_46658/g.98057  ORF Transcript_46658/g.98057 Transcript_46658/m.98057 type:complete len:376 (-) Transcript_46658:3-1130(-)